MLNSTNHIITQSHYVELILEQVKNSTQSFNKDLF